MQPKLPIPNTLVEAHFKKLLPLVEHYKKEKKLHHSILITGLGGVGKKEIALYFIQLLFCDESVFTSEGNGAATRPCGKCKSCKRANDQQWIDLFWFDPESPDEEKLGTHKIDTFRDLRGKMGFGPTEEPYKVVVITEADRMNNSAANSILKSLEEPPPHWIFILTSADSTRLLPTIVSRCIEVKLSPLTNEQIFDSLKEIQGSQFQPQPSKIAARAGMGSLTRAHYFLDEEVWNTRNLILGLLTNPAAEWMKLVDKLALSQKQLALGLDLLESLISDVLQYQIQGANYHWVHEDQKDFLIQWIDQKKLTPEKTIALLEKIAENRKYVGLTLNSKLLAQEVLIPLLETIFS